MFVKSFSAASIARIALMTAVTAVLSQCAIPLPGLVPITLQTFAVALTGAFLGWKQGAVSILVYLLLGCVGVPVFSGFSAGVGALAGPTGGFLVGFPIMACVCGLGQGRSALTGCAFGLLGLALLDMLGALWLARVGGMDFPAALMSGVAPFLIKDVASVILAVLLARLVRRRMPGMN